MLTLWEGLLERLGLKRLKGRRTLPVDESLVNELVEQARLEQMPAEELATEFVITGLAQRKTNKVLKDRWQSLTPREQEITALPAGCIPTVKWRRGWGYRQ